MRTFSDIKATYCHDTHIDIDESFSSLFKKGEAIPHRISVRYTIASNTNNDRTYETTLPKIYPSEKHAVKDMPNVRQPHYTAMVARPHKTNESLMEEKDKKENKYNENNFAILQNIVAKNKGDKLKFKDETDLDVGVKQANAILSSHARLNGDNKKKITNMLHIGKRHFVKLANFCQANYSEK